MSEYKIRPDGKIERKQKSATDTMSIGNVTQSTTDTLDTQYVETTGVSPNSQYMAIDTCAVETWGVWIRNHKLFFVFQFFLTIIYILPVLMLDIIGIRWLIVSNSTSDYFSLNEWLIAEGYPEFLYQILCVPLWIGLICAAIYCAIFKIEKKFYNNSKSKFCAICRLIIALAASCLEGIIGFLVLVV